MNTDPTTPGTVPPEVVSAILRDPDSPYYPAQIGVFCDDCGATVEADYMVSDDMDQAARFEVARAHLRALGWQCDDDADLCPACARAEAQPDGHESDCTCDSDDNTHDGGCATAARWSLTTPAAVSVQDGETG